MTKKKSTAAKNSSSSGAFRQSQLLKEFIENLVRKLTADKKNQNDEFETSCIKKALKQRTANEEGSSSLKFVQSGLLHDFKVNLVQFTDNGTINKESPLLKKSVSEGERTFVVSNLPNMTI